LYRHSAADTELYLAIAADIANWAFTYHVDVEVALPPTRRSKVNACFARRTSVA
jgi:hypothetical protein